MQDDLSPSEEDALGLGNTQPLRPAHTALRDIELDEGLKAGSSSSSDSDDDMLQGLHQSTARIISSISRGEDGDLPRSGRSSAFDKALHLRSIQVKVLPNNFWQTGSWHAVHQSLF